MGLLENTRRPVKNDPEGTLTFPLFPLVRLKKNIHNLPETDPKQITHHQCDAPGIDPMVSPHTRIQ